MLLQNVDGIALQIGDVVVEHADSFERRPREGSTPYDRNVIAVHVKIVHGPDGVESPRVDLPHGQRVQRQRRHAFDVEERVAANRIDSCHVNTQRFDVAHVAEGVHLDGLDVQIVQLDPIDVSHALECARVDLANRTVVD